MSVTTYLEPVVTAARAAALAGREYDLAEASSSPAQAPSPMMLSSTSPTYQPEKSGFFAKAKASDQPEESGFDATTESSNQQEISRLFATARTDITGRVSVWGAGRGADPDLLLCEEHEDENEAESDSSGSGSNSARSEAD